MTAPGPPTLCRASLQGRHGMGTRVSPFSPCPYLLRAVTHPPFPLPQPWLPRRGGEEGLPPAFPAHLHPDGFIATLGEQHQAPSVAPYESTQRGFPVRAILSNPLSTPLEESEAAACGLPVSPHREGKGAVAPATAHTSFITTMAWLDIPSRILLSGARDGTIKFWR